MEGNEKDKVHDRWFRKDEECLRVEGREDEVVASMLFFLVFLDVWWNKAPSRPMEKEICIALSLQQAKGKKGAYARAMRRCRRAAEGREVGAWSTPLLHARHTNNV